MIAADLSPALLGGALVGVASAALFVFNGRIAGVSGIFGDLLLRTDETGRGTWRLLFVFGLVAGCGLVRWMRPDAASITLQTNWLGMIVAGLLVGYGTRLGRGCTSGHGVCGLARRSVRSAVATLVFMVSAAATVILLRHFVSAS